MYIPLLSVSLVRVDDATDHLLHEEPIDGVRRREGATRSLSELKVLLREEMKDGKRERIDRVLRVNGNLDAGQGMLQWREQEHVPSIKKFSPLKFSPIAYIGGEMHKSFPIYSI